LKDDIFVDVTAPISQTVREIITSIIHASGHTRRSVLVRRTAAARNRKRPPNRIVIEETRDAQGRLHCEDGPALLMYLPGDKIPVLEACFLAGKANNVGAPCVVQRALGEWRYTLREMTGTNDYLHHDMLSASLKEYATGGPTRTREVYMWHGGIHSYHLPADIRRDGNTARALYAEWRVCNELVAAIDLQASPLNSYELDRLDSGLRYKSGLFPENYQAHTLRAWRHTRRHAASAAPIGTTLA
jgi:hypothetical protein